MRAMHVFVALTVALLLKEIVPMKMQVEREFVLENDARTDGSRQFGDFVDKVRGPEFMNDAGREELRLEQYFTGAKDSFDFYFGKYKRDGTLNSDQGVGVREDEDAESEMIHLRQKTTQRENGITVANERDEGEFDKRPEGPARQYGHSSTTLLKNPKAKLPEGDLLKKAKRVKRSPSRSNPTTLPTRATHQISITTRAVKTEEDNPRNPVCSAEVSCHNRCNNTRKFSLNVNLTCYCDDDCVNFYDCCADYEKYCTTNTSGALPRPQSGFGREPEKPPDWGLWQCVPWMNSMVRIPGGIGVWMISDCPNGYSNREIWRQCITFGAPWFRVTRDSIVDALPVYSSDGTVYRNRYCALCHGVSANEQDSYGVSFNCENTPPAHFTSAQKFDYLFAYCTRWMTWKARTTSPRRFCYYVSHSKCHQSATRKQYYSCVNGNPAVVYASKEQVNYKNIHCAVCNQVDVGEITCGPGKVNPTGTGLQLAPFSLVFNFGGKSQTPKSITVKIDCPKEEVYDPYLEVCRKGDVPPPRASVLDEYRILLWIKSLDDRDGFHDRIPENVLKGFLTNAFLLDPRYISNIYLKGTKRSKQYKLMFDLLINETADTRQRERDRRSAFTRVSMNKVLNFQSPFNVSLNGTLVTVFGATKRILRCVNMKTYQSSEYAMLSNPISAVFINETSAVLKQKDYYRNATTSDIFVCHGRSLGNCSGAYVSMDTNEFSLLPNNSMFINASNEIISPSYFFTRNGSYWVCRNFSQSYTKIVIEEENDDEVLKIMTLVCLVLSMIALVFFLVTYSLFKELRTTPGINLMNLSVSILLLQLVWVAGSGRTENRGACTAVAILLHYLFLSSFLWTSVIAFDTWRAFSGKSQRATGVTRKERLMRILRYMAAGWLPAMVFVAITTALDQSEAVAIGYGSGKACWIGSAIATVCTFITPVAITLVFNLTFYILTVKAIKSSASQARMAADSGKSHFGIYVRIAAVLGFTWLFAFLAAYVWSPLWYVFVIFNCLQGVYIAAAFALSERARNLYREFFARVKLPHRKRLQDTATSGSTKPATLITPVDSPNTSRAQESTMDTKF